MTSDLHQTVIGQARELEEAGKGTEALAVLEPLVAAEIPDAMTLAGTLLYCGMGIEPDGVRAVALLSRAAELGAGLAAHNLGTLLTTGAHGVAPDAQRAQQYYALAKQLGCDLSKPGSAG